MRKWPEVQEVLRRGGLAGVTHNGPGLFARARVVRRLVSGLLALAIWGAASGAPAANQMANQASPYLALHADDATAWRVWGADAMEEARRDSRLIMVSLGYFACHWCHVMQRETWADAGAAAVINRHFIPVKVDRETHPALDASLQRFAQLTRGRSGWPLTVFLTPEGDPLLAVLYEPRDEFVRIAEGLARRWRADAPGLAALAREAARPPATVPRVALPDDFERAVERSADVLQGGFGEAARFPWVPRLMTLLVLEVRAPSAWRREFLDETLTQMARGGLRDHVAGGYFRYTVDPAWREPHFEKMLYDNAQIALLFLRAAEVLGEPAWIDEARAILDFLLDEMALDGAFVASLSALDAAGEEGGAYLWDDVELRALLAEDEYAVARPAWGLQEASAFAAGHLPIPRVTVAPEQAPLLARAVQRLRDARRSRVIPRDEKRLAGWNGLALSALAAAAPLDARYREAADALFLFARDRLVDRRGARKGVGPGVGGDARDLGPGDLQDHAYLARGLLDYADAAGAPQARALATRLIDQAWRSFQGTRGLRLEMRTLVSAEADAWHDTATPAPAAVLVQVTREAGSADARRRAARELRRALRAARGDALDYASLAQLALTPAPHGASPAASRPSP